MTVLPDVELRDLERAIQESDALLVDFWGPMCAPCRVLKPHLARLAEEHQDRVRFVAVNAEKETTAAERFDVKGVPTLILFRDGNEVLRLTGPILPSRVAQVLETTFA